MPPQVGGSDANEQGGVVWLPRTRALCLSSVSHMSWQCLYCIHRGTFSYYFCWERTEGFPSPQLPQEAVSAWRLGWWRSLESCWRWVSIVPLSWGEQRAQARAASALHVLLRGQDFGPHNIRLSSTVFTANLHSKTISHLP